MGKEDKRPQPARKSGIIIQSHVYVNLGSSGSDGETDQAGIRADETADSRRGAARVRALRRDAYDAAAHRVRGRRDSGSGLLAFRQQADALSRDARPGIAS